MATMHGPIVRMTIQELVHTFMDAEYWINIVMFVNYLHKRGRASSPSQSSCPTNDVGKVFETAQ